jgi:hypothetical protein
MTKTKRPTLIVREVMRRFGKTWLYTNKYKTMRTVKCYAGKPRNDIKMVEAIKRALKKVGIKPEIRQTSYFNERFYSPMESLIVQLPLKK